MNVHVVKQIIGMMNVELYPSFKPEEDAFMTNGWFVSSDGNVHFRGEGLISILKPIFTSWNQPGRARIMSMLGLPDFMEKEQLRVVVNEMLKNQDTIPFASSLALATIMTPIIDRDNNSTFMITQEIKAWREKYPASMPISWFTFNGKDLFSGGHDARKERILEPLRQFSTGTKSGLNMGMHRMLVVIEQHGPVLLEHVT